MKPSELRIGNAVKETLFGRYGVLKYFTPKRVEIKLPISTMKTDFRNIKPIRLTENWLINLGFHAKDDDGNWYHPKEELFEDTGLRIEVLHPVLTTSLPVKYQKLEERILEWCEIKNELYNGQAGTQFSINSTDEAQRTEMYRGMQMHLEDFAKIADKMPDPVSRKYCLNFAFSTDFVIDAKKVAKLFDKDKFMCKITPIHNNTACATNGIKTIGGYDSWKPYQKPEEDLKAEGFDVLVFVPSIDEEDGLVTCGNAILGGSSLKYNEDLIKIEGLEEYNPPYTT